MNHLRTKMIVATMISALFFAGLSSAASATDAATIVNASFDTAQFKKSVDTDNLSVQSEKAEKVTFTVKVTATGEIDDVTYTHTIASDNLKKADGYIQKVYKTILETEFYPAHKDGKNVSDIVTIVVAVS